MGRSVIAVDVDGVLADWHKWSHPVYCELLGVTVAHEECVHYDPTLTYGVTREEFARVHPVVSAMCDTAGLPAVDGVEDALRQLSRVFRIVPVTAREGALHDTTRQWVGRVVEPIVGPTEVYFAAGANNPLATPNAPSVSKLDICRQIDAVCLVEDNPSEVAAIYRSGVEPICIAWPWNQSLVETHPDVMRGDWAQVSAYLLDKYGAAG